MPERLSPPAAAPRLHPVRDVPAQVADTGLGSLPRAWLRPCLLLLLAEEHTHGYELLERLDVLGLDRIDAAGLYRALRAMEQEGLVRSSWEPSSSGPARRTYALTSDGHEWLHVAAGALHLVEESLGRYRERYARLPPPTDMTP
jgi:poly-beta-hydroxybutyrate-responsive repressor